MNQNKLWCLVLGITIVWPGFLWAEILEGEVTNISLEPKAISIQTNNHPGAKRLEILIPAKAELKGITAVGDLQRGERVRVDMFRNAASGKMEAKSLEAFTPRAEKPPLPNQQKIESKLEKEADNGKDVPQVTVKF